MATSIRYGTAATKDGVYDSYAEFLDSGGAQANPGPVVIAGKPAFSVNDINPVPGLPRVRRRLAVTQKQFGVSIPNNSATAFTDTICIKMTAEADFDAVQLIIQNNTANANVYNIIGATTETADTSTNDNLCTPIRGGTSNNALDSASQVGGWRTFQKSGSNNITLSGGTSEAAPSYTLTDWLPLKSIPRADGGTLPLFMLRAYTNGAEFGWSWLSVDADSRVSTAANRGRILQASSAAGNHVTTALSATFSLATSPVPLIIPRFRCRAAGVSVAAIGDSLTENNGLLGSAGQEVFANWLFRACADASTAKNPVCPVNLGMSSQASTNFLAHAGIALPILLPDIAIYSVWSPNDTAGTTERFYDNMLARAFDFIDICTQYNIIPVLKTSTPNDVYDTATDALRLSLDAAVRNVCNNGHAYLMDTALAGLGNSDSPERLIPAYKYDATHFNELAIENVVAPLAKKVIQTVIANHF